MKLIFESWRRFLSENIDENVEELITGATGEDTSVRKAYSYCSVILDTASQSSLRAATEDFLQSHVDQRAKSLLIDTGGPQKLCHHMTFKMGTGSKNPEGLPYTHGQKVDIQISEAKIEFDEDLNDIKGILAGVVDGGITKEGGFAHVTLALRGMSPGKAGKIKSVSLPFPPVSLTGYANIPSSIQEEKVTL